MTTTISTIHKQRFDEIRASLNLLGYKESAFMKVQLLFYEALDISRTYGSDLSNNGLLASLKDLQQNQFEKTNEFTKKPGQRELLIRHFVVRFKTILAQRQAR